MKTHIWLGLGLLALLCTGLTSKAEAAKKGGADAAIAEGDVKAPSDRATGQASGKRAAGTAAGAAVKGPRRSTESGGGTGGTAGKVIPVTTSQGTKCCATCNVWSSDNTCKEWGQCLPGSSGKTNCDAYNTK